MRIIDVKVKMNYKVHVKEKGEKYERYEMEENMIMTMLIIYMHHEI